MLMNIRSRDTFFLAKVPYERIALEGYLVARIRSNLNSRESSVPTGGMHIQVLEGSGEYAQTSMRGLRKSQYMLLKMVVNRPKNAIFANCL